MNELDFKKHLKDLAHGHHHPEEHDWSTSAAPAARKAAPDKRATPARAKRKSTRKS
jgi:hypothetical protein